MYLIIKSLRKKQSNLSYLRTQGYVAYVRILEPKWVRISSRAHGSNKIWILVDLSLGWKPISCKYDLIKKLKPDGTIDKYKAHCVVKCFNQWDNINFF